MFHSKTICCVDSMWLQSMTFNKEEKVFRMHVMFDLSCGWKINAQGTKTEIPGLKKDVEYKTK